MSGRRPAAVVLCAIIGLVQTACMSLAGPPPGGSSGGLPAPPLPAGPGTPETQALLRKLLALAESSSAGNQAELAAQLSAASTLDALDPPAERNRRVPRDLRVARVFDALRANDSAAAAKTLIALTRSEAIQQDWRLQALLIRAFGTRHPLTADAVAYLDAQSKPKSLNLQIVIAALIENESPPATELLGRKLADPALEENSRISWIRHQLLPRRRSAALLRGIEKWLGDDKLARPVRHALAEALFDYRPGEWGGEDPPAPPEERSTSAEAAVVLRRIGKQILESGYPSSTQAAVRRTLANLP